MLTYDPIDLYIDFLLYWSCLYHMVFKIKLAQHSLKFASLLVINANKCRLPVLNFQPILLGTLVL